MLGYESADTLTSTLSASGGKAAISFSFSVNGWLSAGCRATSRRVSCRQGKPPIVRPHILISLGLLRVLSPLVVVAGITWICNWRVWQGEEDSSLVSTTQSQALLFNSITITCFPLHPTSYTCPERRFEKTNKPTKEPSALRKVFKLQILLRFCFGFWPRLEVELALRFILN